jgi:hypothetical protein
MKNDQCKMKNANHLNSFPQEAVREDGIPVLVKNFQYIETALCLNPKSLAQTLFTESKFCGLKFRNIDAQMVHA